MMEQSSQDYAFRQEATDVERTLKMVSTELVGSQTTAAEVSPEFIFQTGRYIIYLVNFIWFSCKNNVKTRNKIGMRTEQ